MRTRLTTPRQSIEQPSILAYVLADTIGDKEQPAINDTEGDALHQIRSKRFRILVVDDEDMFRESLVFRLKALYGATVHGAESWMIALEILDSDDGFDIILMDFSMPEMNGAEAYLALRAKGIQAQVILMSGEASNRTIADMIGLPFITKPLNSRAIEKILLACGGRDNAS